MASTDTLYRPFSLKSLSLPNRIAMAPMTRNKSPDQAPDAAVAAYYRARAEGGVGLILTEGTVVDRSASNRNAIPSFFGDEALSGWAKVVTAVKAVGGHIMPQLWHQGVHRAPGSGPYPHEPTLSPSGIGLDGETICEPMTVAQIRGVVEAFAAAAAAAKRLGFDGVEIHGAHGYLIDQFFWEKTNHRTDAYGGSVANRTRFAAEIVRAVRAAVGPDFPILYRFSQWKILSYDAKLATTPQALEAYIMPLAEAGTDILHASTRRFWLPEFPQTGSGLNLAGWAKAITGLPTITVGSVTLGQLLTTIPPEPSPIDDSHTEALLEMLDRGDVDLVAVGRALIANPDWARTMRAGDVSALRPFDASLLETLS